MNGAHAAASHAPHIPYPHVHPHMNGHAPAPVAGPSSQHIDMGSATSPAGHANGSGSSSGQPKFSNGPHIRSRITVVCAECKRLKLKCDRRTPCSSCLKRDTVPRCVYSQAAAEKIDVQSLHNRTLLLESYLAKALDALPSAVVQGVFGSDFKPPFASGAVGIPLGAATGTNVTPPVVPSISNDRALLATGAGGSSVVISLDDVASIWLTEFTDVLHGQIDPSTGSSSAPRVKVEPTPVLLSAPAPFANASVSSTSSLPRFVPPIPYSKFLPSPEPVGDTHVTNGTDLFPSVGTSAPEPLPQVTPELLKHLPPKERRAEIIRCFEETMVLHPCFHVGHWLKRLEAMVAWGEGGSTSASPVQVPASTTANMREFAHDVFFGGPPGKRAKAPQPQPTLSFFASACAGLALGALVTAKGGPQQSPAPPGHSPASHHSGSRPGTAASSSSAKGLDEPSEAERCSHAALFALSEQALGLAERTAAYDCDAVVAMLLQVLYLLHASPGGMSVQQGVFPLVGKMINVARMMGLANDPDDFPGTYSLFEAEARRRIWWDVFYYDLFVSDCMGHPPLIPDNSFTTHLPADVDEDAFGPSSTVLPAPADSVDGPDKTSAYFALKCRLAQLVKNVKKQTFRDPLGDDPNELSIDQAALFEADVTAFLADLPPAFRLELDRDWTEPAVSKQAAPAKSALLAQKCELVILANRLILKLYLPFLKDGHVGAGKHQAVLATVNAAHAVIYASRVLHGVWAHTRPAAFDLYDFGRALFDAAVVCAHAVVQQPASLLANEALKGVGAALEVLKALGSEASADKNRADAVRVVEMMKRKAEAARANGSGNGAGLKRKRDAVEERMEPGFQLPYVGPSVSSVKPDPSRSPTKAQSGAANSKDVSATHPDALGRKEKKQMREKDRDKSRPPPVGIRARPSQPQHGTNRQRGASVSTNAASVPIPAPVPHTLPPPRHTATPASGPPSAASSSASHMQALPPPHALPPSSSAHDAYVQRAPQTPVHDRMAPEDFPMQFPGDDAERQRYGSTFSDSPPGSSMFDPASLSHPSPVSYGGGPTPPNAYYQYAPPPQPSQGYESAPPPMGHSQNVAPPMGSLPMDASAAQGGLTMSTMVEARYGMQQYRPEHAQAMPPPEYHAQQPPPQPQGMPMSGTHTWLPPEHGAGPDTWNEYKYVG